MAGLILPLLLTFGNLTLRGLATFDLLDLAAFAAIFAACSPARASAVSAPTALVAALPATLLPILMIPPRRLGSRAAMKSSSLSSRDLKIEKLTKSMHVPRKSE